MFPVPDNFLLTSLNVCVAGFLSFHQDGKNGIYKYLGRFNDEVVEFAKKNNVCSLTNK